MIFDSRFKFFFLGSGVLVDEGGFNAPTLKGDRFKRMPEFSRTE